MTSQTKPKMSSKLQYASSHAANYVTAKRVIADAGMTADAKRQTQTKCALKIAEICTSLVNSHCQKTVRRRQIL